jgi:PAS domain S-box-containing protein
MTKVIFQLTDPLKARSDELSKEHLQSIYRRTDRLFAILFVFQWLAGIVIALVVSPRSWTGTHSDIHIHVWSAIFLGGAITVCPLYLAWKRPGQILTRHIIAISQMLFSALLIHLTGGRIETHFHIFGSLAFLAVYSDWRVLITASIVVILDHVLRGIFWPLTIYGVLAVEPMRWLEHAWWVVFEDIFLIKACLNNVREALNVSQRQAEVEQTRGKVEEIVKERTRELHISERRLSTQYAVSKVLAGSDSLTDAAPKILQAIANNMVKDIGDCDGIVYGEIWHPDQYGMINCICNIQWADGHSVKPFCRAEDLRYSPGVGLPGQVFKEQQALQLIDIAQATNFLRRESALAAGFKAAFAFPVIAENEVKAVIVFISESQSALRSDEFSMLESLGQQIGQFIVSKRTELENVQLANIVQSSNDAIIGQSRDGTITSWNRGAERLLGYTSEEAKGNSSAMLLPVDRLKELEHFDLESIENFETVRVAKDLQRKDVSVTSSLILDSTNAVVGTSLILRDITERKESEKRVAEFYSTVSHELRTPLTAIRGALGLIEGGIIEAGTAEAMDLIQVARESSDRLIRLINEILDLKKIEAGKFELVIESLDPERLVKDALESLTGMSEQAGIKLESRTCTNDPLLGDRDRCTQVIINLVSNAIKFSPKGSLVVVTSEKTKAGMVRFSITDTGPGIPEEQLHKLFNKFQQLDSSDTRAKGGTGLGLAISKAIVDEHGGNIGVNSTFGVGTTFWFELPEQAVADQKLPSDEDDAVDSSVASVLVIEDDDQLAHVLNVHISSQGFKVTRANSLRQARSKLTYSTPAVIILDLTLPDGDGLELLEELRNDAATRNIPVVVITGRGAREGCSHSPMIFDWLQKPFDTQMLIQAIERSLSLPSRRRVLVIGEDASTRSRLSDQLSNMSLECMEASDQDEAVKLIQQSAPDLIIIDLDVFDAQLVSNLRRVQTRSAPLIVFSANHLTENGRHELSLGVIKYLTEQNISDSEFQTVVQELIDQVRSPKMQLNKLEILV